MTLPLPHHTPSVWRCWRSFRLSATAIRPARQSVKFIGLVCLWLFAWIAFFGMIPQIWAQYDESIENEKFKITVSSLEELQQGGMEPTIISALNSLKNQLYDNKTAFEKALSGLNTELSDDQQRAIVQRARLDRLMITSDEFSGDLRQGEATFKGNVKGKLPREDIRFLAGKVRIFAEGGKNYSRIMAETKVRVYQWDRELYSDYAVYNRDTHILNLEGNVVMKNTEVKLTGTQANIDGKNEQAEVLGSSSPELEGRIELKFKWKEPDATTPLAEGDSVLRSRRATFTKATNQAVFEGEVEMERSARKMYMKAGRVELYFNQERKLVEAIARQQVCIEQPGRVAKAEEAFFDEIKQTILLKGNAEVTGVGKSLSGNEISLFLDVDKGEARGGDNRPIEMIIDLNETEPVPTQAPTDFNCERITQQ